MPEIGDKFKHKYYKDDMTAEILQRTNKGFKVKQTERRGKKFIEKIAFFSNIDFDKDKGVWIKENVNQMKKKFFDELKPFVDIAKKAKSADEMRDKIRGISGVPSWVSQKFADLYHDDFNKTIRDFYNVVQTNNYVFEGYKMKETLKEMVKRIVEEENPNDERTRIMNIYKKLNELRLIVGQLRDLNFESTLGEELEKDYLSKMATRIKKELGRPEGF